MTTTTARTELLVDGATVLRLVPRHVLLGSILLPEPEKRPGLRTLRGAWRNTPTVEPSPVITPIGGTGEQMYSNIRSRPAGGEGQMYSILRGLPTILRFVGKAVSESDYRGTPEQIEARVLATVSMPCIMVEAPSERLRANLGLEELFRRGDTPPLDMGRAFIAHRARFQSTQQGLSREVGITPGTIHHYESLILDLVPALQSALGEGRLTFKEAREIADWSEEDQARYGPLFSEGRLSSMHVEQVSRTVREQAAAEPVLPTLTADDLICQRPTLMFPIRLSCARILTPTGTI